jgi:hypothetical protein
MKWWRIAVLPISGPLLFVGLLIAAGIMSSTIVETSHVNILLRGNNCGQWKIPSNEELTAFQSRYMIENQRYMRNTGKTSAIYSRNCYNKTDSGVSPACQSFTQPSIPYSSVRNATCPFNETTCLLPDTNLLMDTGEIDTNAMLGI